MVGLSDLFMQMGPILGGSNLQKPMAILKDFP